MTRVDGATELVPPPGTGRSYTMSRRVRLSDANTSGQVRLDAIGRYLQDVATDDARETMPDSHLAWVIRRTLIDVAQVPVSEETITVTTWCSGIGGRWAERRYAVSGDHGARVDAASVWIAIDASTGAPRRLPDDFRSIYEPSSAGRSISARLQHGDPDNELPRTPWRFRVVDADLLGHVNNTAYWTVIEELLGSGSRPTAFVAEMEYRDGVEVDQAVDIAQNRDGEMLRLWLCDGASTLASARWEPR